MSKQTNKNQHSLVVLASTELISKDEQLEQLKSAALDQFSIISKMDKKVARASVICGLTLHRVKASLAYGEFTPFLTNFLPRVCSWTPATALKNASYLMRLAEVFIDKSRISKADILALPGDPLAIALDEKNEAQRFLSKLDAFAGDCSLNELLIKHGIKGVGLKKELEKQAEKEDAEASKPDAEQLYFQYRDEVGGLILRAEDLFVKEGALAHLIGHPEELEGVAKGLRALADKVEIQVAELIASSARTTPTEPAIPSAEDMP